MTFRGFVQNMQSAFGSSRLDRIGLQAPCFRPWGFLGASGGDAFSDECSRAPPRRGPESDFGLALEISRPLGVSWGGLLASLSALFCRFDFWIY